MGEEVRLRVRRDEVARVVNMMARCRVDAVGSV